ncbi:MAG: family 43 glycosylhydrolase [Marinilabiliaceae bacterium]|nr:family 43 glycosylhydrolase [Marinilabiliaceae bacterium]
MKKNLIFKVLILVMVSFFSITQLYAELGIHDPSNIIYNNGRYYIFGTGNGIYMVSSGSSSFSSWTVERSPFANGNPSWISNYVSNFGGSYWAPEIIYMNGKYYLYYSVSMGDRPCAIGLVTTPSLSNPVWSDQGMVVYSNNSSVYGAIDPDVFWDQNGKL